jgi:hypothetical protein
MRNIVIAFFIGAIAAAAAVYFMLPEKIKVVAGAGRIITNTVTKYQEIKSDSNCQGYIDQYNMLRRDYVDFISCRPANIKSSEREIFFSLYNRDVTNDYSISYHVEPAKPDKIFSLSAGIAYRPTNSAGIIVDIGIWQASIGAILLFPLDFTLYAQYEVIRW